MLEGPRASDISRRWKYSQLLIFHYLHTHTHSGRTFCLDDGYYEDSFQLLNLRFQDSDEEVSRGWLPAPFDDGIPIPSR